MLLALSPSPEVDGMRRGLFKPLCMLTAVLLLFSIFLLCFLVLRVFSQSTSTDLEYPVNPNGRQLKASTAASFPRVANKTNAESHY